MMVLKLFGWGMAGVAYGMVLGFCGGLLAGAGHGTTLVMDFGGLIIEGNAVHGAVPLLFWFLVGIAFYLRKERRARFIHLALCLIPYTILSYNLLAGRYSTETLVKYLPDFQYYPSSSLASGPLRKDFF